MGLFVGSMGLAVGAFIGLFVMVRLGVGNGALEGLAVGLFVGSTGLPDGRDVGLFVTGLGVGSFVG